MVSSSDGDGDGVGKDDTMTRMLFFLNGWLSVDGPVMKSMLFFLFPFFLSLFICKPQSTTTSPGFT